MDKIKIRRPPRFLQKQQLHPTPQPQPPPPVVDMEDNKDDDEDEDDYDENNYLSDDSWIYRDDDDEPY